MPPNHKWRNTLRLSGIIDGDQLQEEVGNGVERFNAQNRMGEFAFDRMFPWCRQDQAETIFGPTDYAAEFALDGRYFLRMMSKFERDMLMMLRAFWMEVKSDEGTKTDDQVSEDAGPSEAAEVLPGAGNGAGERTA